jgi:hypothetical protein
MWDDRCVSRLGSSKTSYIWMNIAADHYQCSIPRCVNATVHSAAKYRCKCMKPRQFSPSMNQLSLRHQRWRSLPLVSAPHLKSPQWYAAQSRVCLAEGSWRNRSAWFVTVSASVIVLAGSTCRLACCSSGWYWFWLACTLVYRVVCCNEGRYTIPLPERSAHCRHTRKWAGSLGHSPLRDN